MYVAFDCDCLTMDVLDNLRLELRRGCLVLAVLAKLHSEYHGYALSKALAESGLDVDENTLYPLLRRLENQKLLVSQWRVEDKRNKRFYRLSRKDSRCWNGCWRSGGVSTERLRTCWRRPWRQEGKKHEAETDE